MAEPLISLCEGLMKANNRNRGRIKYKQNIQPRISRNQQADNEEGGARGGASVIQEESDRGIGQGRP
ncbi:hypothetical protein XENTR_v10023132 [Xenopus tropicalis]|nr:hypothetical protein XENTR_v10023132 [Xenopus tropicalis]